MATRRASDTLTKVAPSVTDTVMTMLVVNPGIYVVGPIFQSGLLYQFILASKY
jgi:hypothetical protein